jgi:hypothetical protein
MVLDFVIQGLCDIQIQIKTNKLGKNVFVHVWCLYTSKNGAYPQEDFLFVKLITSFRITLLNNCKKDFQFHIKTTETKFFYTKNNFFFMRSHDSRLHFRLHKVYFFELTIKFLIDG